MAGHDSPLVAQRLALLTLLWAGAALLGLAGCGDLTISDPDPSERLSKPVEIETVAPRSFTSWTRVPGIVEARSEMALPFRVPGFIASFPAEEGERVEAGAVIAELDRRDNERAVRLARAALESAQAHAADTQRELERQERLLSSDSTSSQKLESSRSAHLVATAEARQAQLHLEAAEIALEDCVLRAPVAGYIERQLVEEHEFAAQHVPVVILTELDVVSIRSTLADRSLSALTLGRPATVTSGAWPGRSFEGRISQVGVAADPTAHTLPFEVELANEDLALRPSMVVEIGIPIGGESEVLTVPMNAVVRDGGLQALCFVASGPPESLHAEPRPVALGKLRGNRITIQGGLAAGERVIVRGQHFLQPGDPIHISTPSAHAEAGP